MTEGISIGKMAKINNVSEQTLRFYEKKGLLRPYIKNENNNYRYYSFRQSAKLDLIQHMKALGLSLNDIKEQMSTNNSSDILELLKEKEKLLDKKLIELKYQKRAVKKAIERTKLYDQSPQDGTIRIEFFDERFIYSVDSSGLFYEAGIDEYEKALRDLKKSMKQDKIPDVYFCNPGSILVKESFENKDFRKIKLFAFVDDDFKYTSKLKSGKYLCIYCNNFYKEKEYIDILKSYIYKNNLEIIGDYICETIYDLENINEENISMFLRLQILIK